MDFISNQEQQNQKMRFDLGINTVDELFQAIPSQLRMSRPLKDDGLSESEGMRLMEDLAAKNTFPKFDNYLGAGSYEHHVPAIVGAICAKSEFLTSYTPYQPEASQGMLQCIFEYQSAICALTGLDVANASLYDGASACAEALLMSLRCQKGRSKVLVCDSLHPQYRGVIAQYLSSPDIKKKSIPFLSDGSIDLSFFEANLDTDTAAVIVQYPNFFGSIDDLRSISLKAKAMGALMIVCANPVVYGLYASAKELGADIAVGDGQPFGLPMQFGGPYAGYLACRQDLIRQLPGRIVGETVDTQGRRGFVLTLQAREQHIRREKATSNICTNQALAALANLVGILWYGKEGVYKLALTNYQRARYLQKMLLDITEETPFAKVPIFNEFVIKCKRPIDELKRHFMSHNIIPGLDLSKYYPQLKDHLLISVTEMKTKEQLDRYVKVMKSV